jgi:uncharacterized membrane protein
MDVYLIVLRIVHVIARAFWIGAGLTASLFLQPTAREAGPAAGPFMTHLAQRKRLPDVMLAAAGLTILAGLLMYWQVSYGFDADWIGSSYGLTITIGALAGRRVDAWAAGRGDGAHGGRAVRVAGAMDRARRVIWMKRR